MTTHREGNLHLLCGKMASGKSTLAAQLADEHAALLLAEDDWLATLYPGEIVDVPSYVRCADRLRAALRDHLVDLLRRRVPLVLDFPANTPGQRAWLRGLANDAGLEHVLHYLERSDAQCLAQMERRRVECPDRHATDTAELFQAITRHFVPPDPNEGLTIERHG